MGAPCFMQLRYRTEGKRWRPYRRLPGSRDRTSACRRCLSIPGNPGFFHRELDLHDCRKGRRCHSRRRCKEPVVAPRSSFSCYFARTFYAVESLLVPGIHVRVVIVLLTAAVLCSGCAFQNKDFSPCAEYA